jgi:hypothetical protein
MRIVIAAAAVLASALLAIGVLSVASAETTPTPAPAASAPPRTVSVQGVATAPVAQAANAATATAAYRQAMAAAVADGQAKAQFLAEKTGATLGVVQSIGEGGGSIECPAGEEYAGEQPDFGYAEGGEVFAAAPRAPVARPIPARRKQPIRHHKQKHHAKARRAGLSTELRTYPCALGHSPGQHAPTRGRDASRSPAWAIRTPRGCAPKKNRLASQDARAPLESPAARLAPQRVQRRRGAAR